MSYRQRIIPLLDGTRTVWEIATELGCSRQAVYGCIHKFRLPFKRDPLTKTERNRALVEGWRSGMSKSALARKYGISVARVSYIIDRDCEVYGGNEDV